MKKQIGIWIDRQNAILVKLTEGNEEFVEIPSDIENRVYHDKEGDKGSFWGSTHSSKDKSFEERKKQQTTQYLKTVRDEVTGFDEVYILGPAETKNQLKKLIEEDKTFTLKTVSVENAERMTNNQLTARVKEFYGWKTR